MNSRLSLIVLLLVALIAMTLAELAPDRPLIRAKRQYNYYGYGYRYPVGYALNTWSYSPYNYQIPDLHIASPYGPRNYPW
ncbi:unnamed protein product, partial [Mesorhabditis spiculigera]